MDFPWEKIRKSKTVLKGRIAEVLSIVPKDIGVVLSFRPGDEKKVDQDVKQELVSNLEDLTDMIVCHLDEGSRYELYQTPDKELCILLKLSMSFLSFLKNPKMTKSQSEHAHDVYQYWSTTCHCLLGDFQQRPKQKASKEHKKLMGSVLALEED